MTDLRAKAEAIAADVSLEERLAELKRGRDSAPVLAHYWHWCREIREVEAQIDAERLDRARPLFDEENVS